MSADDPRSQVVFSSTDLDVVEDATTTTFTAIETSTEYETLDPADPETVYLTETADVVTETPDPVTYTLLGDEETQWVTRTRPKTVSSTYTVTATLYVNRRRSVELPAVTPAPGSVGPVGRSEERAQVLSLESRACPVAVRPPPCSLHTIPDLAVAALQSALHLPLVVESQAHGQSRPKAPSRSLQASRRLERKGVRLVRGRCSARHRVADGEGR